MQTKSKSENSVDLHNKPVDRPAVSEGIEAFGALPAQLKGWRFIKLRPRDKIPVEPEWPTTANYEYGAPQLLEHIANGGNYGVMGDKEHVIIDGDSAEVQDAVERYLPETFTVRTPGHAGKHYYYLTSLDAPVRLKDRDGKNVGDVQGAGKQVVGPGSIHPNGEVYTIINPSMCAQVTAEQIREALSEFITPEPATIDWEKLERKTEIPITSVHSIEGMKRQGAEYYGVHPVHGSDTGHNFWINVEKNVWHCFRHGTGGGPLSLLAVKEGTIKCEEARPGALRRAVFKQIKLKLKEKGIAAEKRAEPPPPETFSPEALEKAKVLRQDPVAFIQFLQRCLNYRLAGEERNRLFMIIIAAAAKVMTTLVRLYGPNAVGKRMLYYWLGEFLPRGDVIIFSSNTAAWLNRKILKGEIDPRGKVIILIEERGDRGNTKYTFEQIYSEDKIKVGFNIRGESGDWEPVEVEMQGPLTFITTSTELEESFHALTREWEVNPDESQGQSNRIAEWVNWRELRSIRDLEQEKKKIEVIRAYFSLLKPYKRYVIPFVKEIKFEYRTLGDRRKKPDLMNLIRAVTFLFQELCPKDEENGIIFAAPFTFDIVMACAEDIIAVSRGDLNRTEKRLQNFIAEHYSDIVSVTKDGKPPTPDVLRDGEVMKAGQPPEAFTVGDIARRPEFTDLHEDTIRNNLRGLARKGMLVQTVEGRGRAGVWMPVPKVPLRNSEGAKSPLIPELMPISASDLEIRSSEIYEGFDLKPALQPAWNTPIKNSELRNFRIRPETLLFPQKDPEITLLSSEVENSELPHKEPLREERPDKTPPLAQFKCKLCGVGQGYYSSCELLQEHLAAVHGIEKQNEKGELQQ